MACCDEISFGKTCKALISFLLGYSIVTDNNRDKKKKKNKKKEEEEEEEKKKKKKKKNVMWDKLFLGFTQTRRNLSLKH